MTAPRPFAEVVEELTRLDAAATPGPIRAQGPLLKDDPDVSLIPLAVLERRTRDNFSVILAQFVNSADRDEYVAMRNALPLLLSRLASREAVFEAAVAYLSDAHDCNDDEPCPHYDALSAAIAAARALDAATPQGEEGK